MPAEQKRLGLSVCGVLVVALGAPLARAEPADPTVAVTAESQPPKPASDPCDAVPRCRLARFRAELAHARRLEYLARIDQAAREMDARIDRAAPWRARYFVEADFLYASNGAIGALLAYAPLWWLKLEAYAGWFNHLGSQSQNGSYFSSTVDGTSIGTQVRLLPIRWALSPYVAVGWSALVSGHIDGSLFGPGGYGGSARADADSHFVDLGIGLELVVPYFHVALGYQLAESFYAQARINQAHNDALRSVLEKNLDDDRHGVVVEIGCAF